jgi:peptidoglycan biosynthesis protein MviN/MurJ (putative lipid II flippase)
MHIQDKIAIAMIAILIPAYYLRGDWQTPILYTTCFFVGWLASKIFKREKK